MTVKKTVLCAVFVCLALGAFYPLARAMEVRGRKPAAVQLKEPGDDPDLTGKAAVRFRWSPEGGPGSFDRYDFRLYKGHETVEKGLIFQRDVPPGENFTDVDGALFADGETYAWSVKQVGGRTKSRTAYAVFKAIKRDAPAATQP